MIFASSKTRICLVSGEVWAWLWTTKLDAWERHRTCFKKYGSYFHRLASQCVYSNPLQVSCTHQKPHFPFCLQVFRASPFFFSVDAHFRSSLINVHTSAVPDMLMDLFLNINGRPDSASTLIHSTLDLCINQQIFLVHKIFVVQNCHSPVNVTSFHGPWPQWSQSIVLWYILNGSSMLNVSQY